MRVFIVAAVVLLWAGASVAQQTAPEELFRQAQQAQQAGDNATAVSKYNELLRVHPEIVAAHANLGVVLASMGRYDEAIAEYHFALAEAPGSPALLLDLGLAYYRKQDFAGAGAQFAVLHQQDPNNLRVTILLGDCQVQMGLPAVAVAMLQPLEKDNADNLDLAWALGTALIRSGKTLDGLERVQKVAEKGNNAEAYKMAADYWLGLTFFDKAKQDAEALLRLDPKSANAYIVLGMVADYSADPKTAIEDYSKALELEPNNMQANMQLASVLVHQGDSKRAREYLDRVLAVDPHSSGAHYLLAKTEETNGNTAAAVKDLEAAAREEPKWLPPHVELVALYYRLKRPEDGEREKKIVDELRASEQARRGATRIISPQVPRQ